MGSDKQSGGRRPPVSSYTKWVISLVVVGGLTVIVLVGYSIRLLSSVAPEVAAAIVSAAAVIVVGIVGSILSSYFSRREQIEQEPRQRKAEVYERLLAYWIWTSENWSTAKENEKKKKQQEYHRDVPQQLAVWASADVIQEYRAWFQSEREGTMLGLENMMRLIRADLGYRDSKLQQGDLLGLLYNGADEYVQERSRSSRLSD